MALLVQLFDFFSIQNVLFLLLGLLAVSWSMKRPSNFPPGPWRFPIAGFSPQLVWYMYKGKELHLLALRLAREYGNLYSFDLFGYVFVVMNEFSVIEEGSNNPLLRNKGHNNDVEKKLFGKHRKCYVRLSDEVFPQILA